MLSLAQSNVRQKWISTTRCYIYHMKKFQLNNRCQVWCLSTYLLFFSLWHLVKAIFILVFSFVTEYQCRWKFKRYVASWDSCEWKFNRQVNVNLVKRRLRFRWSYAQNTLNVGKKLQALLYVHSKFTLANSVYKGPLHTWPFLTLAWELNAHLHGDFRLI